MSGRGGGGGGGGGRDRFRRDYPSRFEDKMSSHSGSGRNLNSNSNNNNSNSSGHPPSRHLWVGNLSHSILEHELTNHFLQFGELDSVAFQPGRSYAFLNFKRDDDAFAAINALQGFPVAGNPLRIEYTKAIPFCVVAGWVMGRPMDLNFQLFETATLFITVLVVAFMVQDGTSNYLKGLMLVLCYPIVAASFFVHIDPSSIADKPPKPSH